MISGRKSAQKEPKIYYDPGTTRERVLYGVLTAAVFVAPPAVSEFSLQTWSIIIIATVVVLTIAYLLFGSIRQALR
jgi:hypothetical protein